jgi:hypothetical protein
MRVSDKNEPVNNVIKLVECLKKIKTDKATISFYAEKMTNGNGEEIIY